MTTIVTTFLVIRHGESAANAGGYYAGQSDSPLTELGRAQAARLAAALDGTPIAAVYSSDLSRARETVAPLASARALALTEDPLLRERDMGAFTRVTFDAARAEHPELWARLLARDPDAAPPGGESPRQLAARVARFVAGLAERHRGQTVVLGSHGGTIQHLVRQLLGITELSVPLWIQTANAGVTRIELYESGPGLSSARLAYANRVLPLGDEPTLP